MKKTAIVALCALFAASAGAQSMGEKTGVDSMLGVTPSTEDFVKEVAMSDMLEIQSSKLALDKGDAQAKSFAQHMITDHQKTTTELQGLVKTGAVKVTPPSELDAPHQSKLDKLKKETGRDFANSYDELQVSAHKDAVSLFERYAKGGDNPQLKDWAGKTLPTLQQHLQMAEALNKAS
jgi:putative membrane protein